MSLYAEYVKERLGHEVLETECGFIEYSFAPPLCLLHEIFIVPKVRLKGKARELTNEIVKRAKEKGCNLAWSQVWTNALNANDSLKAHLACGFSVREAQGNCIILTKSLED